MKTTTDNTSAFAVVGPMRGIRLQSVAYPPFDLERLRTAAYPFSERELPTLCGRSQNWKAVV